MSEQKVRRRRTPQSNVGYGRPPVDQQFGQPTRTGRVNTSGRPKKKKAPPSFDDALNEKVFVNEEGRKRSYTRREVAYKQVARLASEGDLKAIKMVMEYDARLNEGNDDADPFISDPKLMKEMLEKHDKETAERALRRSGSRHGGSDDEC